MSINLTHNNQSIDTTLTDLSENINFSDRPNKRVALEATNLSKYEIVYIAQYLPTYILGIFAKLNHQGVTFMTPALLHRIGKLGYIGKNPLEAWVYLKLINRIVTYICELQDIEWIGITNFDIFAENIHTLPSETIFDIFADKTLYQEVDFAGKKTSCAELLHIHSKLQQREVCHFSLQPLASKALGHAVDANRTEIIQLLVQLGANVNYIPRDEWWPNVPRTDKHRYPLHRAVHALHIEAVTLLIKEGADVNAKDHYLNGGNTPLDIACGGCSLGAHPSAKQELARHNIRQLLIQHGARHGSLHSTSPLALL